MPHTNKNPPHKAVLFVTDYYTGDILEVFDNFPDALVFCKANPDSEITDENDNYYYSNIEIPF